MKTVQEVLIKEPGNYSLPLILIDPNGRVTKYKSIQHYLNLYAKFDGEPQGFQIEYKNGCVQLDLTGEESFVIIFYKFPDITC